MEIQTPKKHSFPKRYVRWAIGIEASPEIMQLLEEALKMPKKPNWDLRPDLALQQ